MTKRDFLRKSAALAGGLFATYLFEPFNAILFAADTENKTGISYGIGIDLEKCIGCGSCAKACKNENNITEKYFRNWVEQYTITNDHDIKVESPNGGIDGFTQSFQEENIFKSFFVPKMCNHCSKSPCVQVCPVGATFHSPDGVVLVDKNYCLGCGYCVQACPYGSRYIDHDAGVVDKCTLCYHRIKKGMSPACVAVCPTNARIYGDLNEKDGVMQKFLKEHNCMVLKPHLNTGCKLFYNSLNSEVR
ncbi:MAG: 4Fe-4S dicluster domain-containing protein [Bacteroidota bacterium]